jgi:hypothetical protein
MDTGTTHTGTTHTGTTHTGTTHTGTTHTGTGNPESTMDLIRIPIRYTRKSTLYLIGRHVEYNEQVADNHAQIIGPAGAQCRPQLLNLFRMIVAKLAGDVEHVVGHHLSGLG